MIAPSPRKLTVSTVVYFHYVNASIITSAIPIIGYISSLDNLTNDSGMPDSDCPELHLYQILWKILCIVHAAIEYKLKTCQQQYHLIRVKLKNL